MIDRGRGIETISDENFIKRASYFIMSKELAGKDYIMNQGAFRCGADYVAAVKRAKEEAEKTL